MKKILALLFVCAGLTAMAAPQFNRADIVKAPSAAKVMKAPSMAAQFSAPAMGKQSSSLSKYVRDNNVNLNENRLSKKAPLRLGEEEITAEKIVFMDAYDLHFDDSDNLVV